MAGHRRLIELKEVYYAPGVVENLLSLRRLRSAGGSMTFPSITSGECPHLSLNDGFKVKCEERDASTYLSLSSFSRALTTDESMIDYLQGDKDKETTHILSGGAARQTLYKVNTVGGGDEFSDADPHVPDESSAEGDELLPRSGSSIDINFLHQQCGHASGPYLRKLAQKNNILLHGILRHCEACAVSKAHRLPFRTETLQPPTAPYEGISAD
jgi:hypothetical protein